MKILSSIDSLSEKIGQLVPEWSVALVARVAIFFVFWKSVQTKIDGLSFAGQDFAFWSVTSTAKTLFAYEYALPLIPSDLAAYLATFGEFFFSLGLLFGLFTRLSALGLLLMVAVIQIFVYPNAWGLHLLWAGLLLYLVRNGGGKISLDHLLRRT